MEILRSGEPGYDTYRRVWNGMIDRCPRLIARCASTADVVAAVRTARDLGLEIGVRCGGHSTVGHAVPHDGLTGARMALDRKAWNEPGGADAVRLEQSKNALRAEKPELPARERGRAGHAAGDEPGLRVEVEGQTDDVARHPALPNVDTGAIRIA